MTSALMGILLGIDLLSDSPRLFARQVPPRGLQDQDSAVSPTCRSSAFSFRSQIVTLCIGSTGCETQLSLVTTYTDKCL